MAKKKANGEGSIYYDADKKKYRAAITDPEGKRVSKRFATRTEADEWLTGIKFEIHGKTYVPANDYKLLDWMQEYIRTYCAPHLRPKTAVGYYQTAAHLEPISAYFLQDLDAHTVQLFINRLPSEMAASTKIKVFRLLKAACKKAVQLGLLKKNVVDFVTPPKFSKNRHIEIFTQDEIRRIIDGAKQSNIYPIIILAIFTGCRMGELLGLKVEDVHPDHIEIKRSVSEVLSMPTIQEPKTAAGVRRVTISAQIYAALPLDGKSPDDFVFTTKRKTLYRTSNICKYWKAALTSVGVPYRNFHALRHTHATQLLAAGVPLLEVSKRLGHAKPSHTLDLYGHAVPGLDSKIPDKLAQLFGGI